MKRRLIVISHFRQSNYNILTEDFYNNVFFVRIYEIRRWEPVTVFNLLRTSYTLKEPRGRDSRIFHGFCALIAKKKLLSNELCGLIAPLYVFSQLFFFVRYSFGKAVVGSYLSVSFSLSVTHIIHSCWLNLHVADVLCNNRVVILFSWFFFSQWTDYAEIMSGHNGKSGPIGLYILKMGKTQLARFDCLTPCRIFV